MDDRTAYKILKIREGASVSEISKRHEHFIVLYKHYLMGEELYMSSEEIEKMKTAYESLLYKKIGDNELPFLYPWENNSRCYQTYDKILRPLARRYKFRIVFTLLMAALTWMIVFIINYQPVDIKIAVYSNPYKTLYEYQMTKLDAEAFNREICESLPGIKRPHIEYCYFFSAYERMQAITELYTSSSTDVYLIEESAYKDLKRIEAEYPGVGEKMTGINVNEDSSLFKIISGAANENQKWVAIISPLSKHKKQALSFARLVGMSTE